MTGYLLARVVEPGADDQAAVDDATARHRARHAEHCEGCSCVETIRAETIAEVVAAVDVDGIPSGVITLRRPMVTAHYRRIRGVPPGRHTAAHQPEGEP